MIVLPIFLWIAAWVVVAVVACAVLGLPPGPRMLETAAVIFVCGGILLPGAGFAIFRAVRGGKPGD